MDLDNRKKVVLGIFISLGLIILIGAIYYMGTTRRLFGDRINIYAVFHNVEGLKEGNNVWFSGIKVGVVKSVELATDSTVRAELVVDEDAAAFIKKDSHITIQSQGLMGNKIISISSGSSHTPSVEDGDRLPTREPMSIDDIMNTIKDTAGETANLASNLAEISKKIQKGEGVIGKLIYDTVMSQRIKVSISMLEQSSRNAKQFTEEINEVAYNLSEGDGVAARMLNNEQWAKEIDATLDSLHKASAMVTAAGRDLQLFAEKLNREKGTIQQLLSDSVMAKDMHEALINIKKGTENMDEVMSTINRSWILNLFRKDKD
jgi:phospholipid/cholesterol/gamma-HCH transport system substrate-binding protein